MKLKEYEGKKIFSDYGINIPNSVLITGPSYNIKSLTDNVVVKAQVFSGSRQKAGLIKITKKENAPAVIQEFFRKGVSEILVEEKLSIEKEIYLSYTINREKQCYTMFFSHEGGIDIEELAEQHPEKIQRYEFFAFNRSLCSKVIKDKELVSLAEKLFKIFKDYDCLLAEINPLVITTQGTVVAADAKLIIDDNSLFKHGEFRKDLELNNMEKKAFLKGLNYVELDGNIGVIGCGAGLVMATIDIISYFKGKAACFLDVGGGASYEKMRDGLEIVCSNKNVQGIFINIFGGITKCDEIARGILEFLDQHSPEVKLVVRMIGTNEALAKKMLEARGIHCMDGMEEGAKKIVEIVL